MPFVTEEIWSAAATCAHTWRRTPRVSHDRRLPAPTAPGSTNDAEHELAVVQDIVRAIRNLRTRARIDAGRWLEVYVVGSDSPPRHQPAIELLARVRPLHIIASASEAPSDGVASAVVDEATVIIPMAGLFDVAAERARTSRSRSRRRRERSARLEAQLANEHFTSRAPEQVVQAARERLEAARTRVPSLCGRVFTGAELASASRVLKKDGSSEGMS